MYQLFIFFMITDPKTTVHRGGRSVWSPSWSPRWKRHCGSCSSYTRPYYALFIVGPTANLIEIALARRAARLATAPAYTAAGASARPLIAPGDPACSNVT